MAKFPLIPISLIGTFQLELGKGKGFPISTSSPPTFIAGSLAKYDRPNNRLIDMPDGANEDLVLALEPAQDPLYEAAGRDDHRKEIASGVFVKGFQGVMSTGGRAIQSGDIGAEGVLKIDATTKLPYIDLSDNTTATKGVRIVSLAPGYFATVTGGDDNIDGMAMPAIGDEQAPVIVEFLG